MNGARMNIRLGRIFIALVLCITLFGGMWLSRRTDNVNKHEVTQEPGSKQVQTELRDGNIVPKNTRPELTPPHQQTTLNHAAEPGCHLIHFKHQHPGKKSRASCNQHGNQLALPADLALKASSAEIMCVRIDDQAVAYRKNGAELSFNSATDAIVNPDSVITVLYCIGTSKCPNGACLATGGLKDPFLSAIGAEVQARGKPTSLGIEAKWDPSDPELDIDVSANLPRELLSDKPVPVNSKPGVFKNWIAFSLEKACTGSVASAR